MSLKVTTVLEITLNEMLHESFEVLKQVIDCYFDLSTGKGVSKQRLDKLKPHIEQLKLLEDNLP